MGQKLITIAIAAASLTACGGDDNEVGEFKNDWLGNEIKIEALRDSDIPGVVCHLTHFDRGVWDRIGKGNWFEDPSNSSISCQRSGPIDISDVRRNKSGEEIFNQRQSLVFKQMSVRRVVDLDNNTLLYVSYSRRPVEGSAKMSLSTIPLTIEETTPFKDDE